KRAHKLNMLPFLEEMKAQGKIKHLGFSFHDEEAFFEEVVDSYPWDFCQIQLNYMDAEFQAGVKGLNYAAEKGLSVIVMEPLKGGKLTDKMPASIEAYWAEADIQRTPAQWALRWVANFPEVMTILSGMSAEEQLAENIKTIEEALPNSLTQKEEAIINKVAAKYNALIKFSCTACKYCMPCPQKIDIPTVIGLYNEWFLYEGNAKTKSDFEMWLPKGRRPSDCTACKACEGHCPQALPVSEIMKLAAEIFE
ncbi:MAG: aldo/keto reductase, partial [Anaerovoracaceae bacterium]